MSGFSNADPEEKGPEGQQQSGNIWGWRFSMYSLIFILLVVGVAVCRHIMLGVPFRGQGEPEQLEMVRDSGVAGKDTLR